MGFKLKATMQMQNKDHPSNLVKKGLYRQKSSIWGNL